MKFLRQADGTSLECFAQSMGGPFRKHKLKLSCGIVEGDRQKNMTLTCRTGRVDRDRAVVQQMEDSMRVVTDLHRWILQMTPILNPRSIFVVHS
jgi:hypothetical protein